MGVATVTELKQSISGKRTFRPSLSTRHANEWPPLDVSSDLTVEVGTTSFPLHKFPLVSRSGKIRKLLFEARDSKVTRINLQGTPGGAEAFELAAKFCYGVSIEIALSNVAMLSCAAHYLQMSEEFCERNLEARAELFLQETVFPSITNSIAVLHRCEALLPAAEETDLVGRLIAGIADNVCREQLTCGLSKLEPGGPHSKPAAAAEQEPPPDWWGKALAVLGLEFFQRVLSSVKSKGLRQDAVSRILINYARNSLQCLGVREARSGGPGLSDSEAGLKRQKAIVEAVVGLLPAQSRKSPVPMAFLSGLLKAATAAGASGICKADLERRIGLQLDQAILEDVLIPSSPRDGHRALYEADSAARIFSVFLNLDEEEEEERARLREDGDGCYDFESPRSPKQSSILKVAKLLDGYLAEIALDSNTMPSKFISLAELMPDHARAVADGLYRAVDIFLKVHPHIKESERYRLCKTIDCQKLSQEACSHAAQNERLPVQMAVQVLYFEQIRLRNALNGSQDQFFFGSASCQYPQRSGSGVGSGAISPRDNYASVRRENRELKLEVARMRMRLTDLEKDHVSMRQELVKVNPANKLLRSFTKKLSKLNQLFRMRDVKPIGARGGVDPRFLFQRRRRHSIS